MANLTAKLDASSSESEDGPKSSPKHHRFSSTPSTPLPAISSSIKPSSSSASDILSSLSAESDTTKSDSSKRRSSYSTASTILQAFDPLTRSNLDLLSSSSSLSPSPLLSTSSATRTRSSISKRLDSLPDYQSAACQVSPGIVNTKQIGVNTDIDYGMMKKISAQYFVDKTSIKSQTDEVFPPKRAKKCTRDVAVGTEKFSRERFSILPEIRSRYTQTESTCLRTKSRGVCTDIIPEQPTEEVISLPKRPKFRLSREILEISTVSKDVQTDSPPAKKDASIETYSFGQLFRPQLTGLQLTHDKELLVSEKFEQSIYKPQTKDQQTMTIRSIGTETSDLFSKELVARKDLSVSKRKTNLTIQTRPPSLASSSYDENSDDTDDINGRYSQTSTIIEEPYSPPPIQKSIKPSHEEGESKSGQVETKIEEIIEKKKEEELESQLDSQKETKAQIPSSPIKIDQATSPVRELSSANLVPNQEAAVVQTMDSKASSEQQQQQQAPSIAEQYNILANLTRHLKTQSKVIVTINQPHRREVSEISSETEMGKDGKLQRKTQVTTSTKVPVIERVEYPEYRQNVDDDLDDVESHQSQPVITSPQHSSAIHSPKSKMSYSHGTILSDFTSPQLTRPSSSMDINQFMSSSEPAIPQMANRPSYSQANITNLARLNKNLSKPLRIMINDQPRSADNVFSPPPIETESTSRMSEVDKSSPTKNIDKSPTEYQLMKHVNGVLASKLVRQCERNSPRKAHQVTWHEANHSTICSQMSTDPFRDENDEIAKLKSVTMTSETIISGKGANKKVETRSRASRAFDNKAIYEPDIQSETILSDSPPIQRKVPRSQYEEKKPYEDHEALPDTTSDQENNKYFTKRSTLEQLLRETNLGKNDNHNDYEDQQSASEKIRIPKQTSTTPSSPTRSRHPSTNEWTKNFHHPIQQLIDNGQISMPLRTSYSTPKLDQHSQEASNLYFRSPNRSESMDTRFLASKNGSSNIESSHHHRKPLAEPASFTSPQPTESIDSGLKLDDSGELDMKQVESSPSAREIEVPLMEELKNDHNDGRNLDSKYNSKGETEIITSLTKTTSPNVYGSYLGLNKNARSRRPPTSKLVLEQQLRSGDAINGPDGCKIFSNLTLERANFRAAKKCMQSMKDLRIANGQEDGEEENTCPINLKRCGSVDALNKSNSQFPSKSSQIYSQRFQGSKAEITNGQADEIITTSKFEKHKSPPGRGGPPTTTWKYSMECNCINGVNTSLR